MVVDDDKLEVVVVAAVGVVSSQRKNIYTDDLFR